MPTSDPTVFTAISDFSARFDSAHVRVLGKLDDIHDAQSKLSTRMAAVETLGSYQKEADARWWDKTWPEHLATLNRALEAHGNRIAALENVQVTQEKLHALECEIDEQKAEVQRHQDTIIEMVKFQEKLKVYVAIAGALGGAIVAGIGGLFFTHFKH
jgi:hypothetical protein